MINQVKSRAWFKRVVGGLVLILLIAGQALADEKPMVIYDKETDTSSIRADKVSLKGLLARIGLISGVAFYMDPAAEKPVTVLLREQRLERGLKKMFEAQNLSSAMIYEQKEGQDPAGEPLLIAVKVVPNASGSGSNANLAPVVDLEGEAMIRSFSRSPRGKEHGPSSIFSYLEERWQARLKRMPPEKRAKIEADTRQRQELRAAKQAEKDKQKAEHEARKSAQKAQWQDKAESFKAANPELYEKLQQRGAETRQRIEEEQAMEQTAGETE